MNRILDYSEPMEFFDGTGHRLSSSFLDNQSCRSILNFLQLEEIRFVHIEENAVAIIKSAGNDRMD